MFLEIATSIGALFGAFLASIVSAHAIAVIFGAVLLYSAWQSRHPPAGQSCSEDQPRDPVATYLKLHGEYPTPAGPKLYCVTGVPAGFGLMFGAGTLSGLLGIGSGAVKVLAMDRAMRLPFKVSTTTSNFMIGVTAAASAGVYLSRGYIDPVLSMPVVLGVLSGALIGARFLAVAKTQVLRTIFAFVIAALAIEMIYNGLARNL